MSADARTRGRLDVRMTLCAVPALALLVGLGVWQLQRLAWKEDLVATRAARLAGPVLAVPGAADWRRHEHRRVGLEGRYLHDREMLVVHRLRRGQAGYGVITPLLLDDGTAVLVDRGWAPLSRRTAPAADGGGRIAAVGVLRAGGRLSAWRPDNDPAAGTWFFVDVPQMAAAAGLARARPFYVRLIPAAGGSGFPEPQEPGRQIANRHLEYALTWFGLAAVLIVTFVAYHRRRR